MSEEAVIRKRLAVEGDSGQDDRRLTGLLKTFLKWCAAENLSQEENEATFQKMLFTLEQVEFAFSRSELVVAMNHDEELRYESLVTQVKDEIEVIQLQIKALRDDLTNAREVRQHRQEYDAMATIIQKHPARELTKKNIESLQNKLQDLTRRLTELAEQLSLRRNQGHLLVLAIQQLMDNSDKQSGDNDSSTPMDI